MSGPNGGLTFDRAPQPSFPGSAEPLEKSAGTAADELDPERSQREQELAGDEELAAQLAAQLRLTSPAEHGPPEAHDGGSEMARLPRVGDSGTTANGDSGGAGRLAAGGASGTSEEPHYAVEYHAMDSDGEDAFAFGQAQQRAGVSSASEVICQLLTDLVVSGRRCLRFGALTGAQATSLRSSDDIFETGLG
eukprot:TRINITY_DN19210_c0_g1_i1.p1 TRINITY_DN19210_c0_g1~~TRINITY_DN19210_c0_g1_i1.p1  ORF type:complete len:192 (+),score=40.93 TRINITY_DN19210_c0_g1_i1:153-728(+)